MNRRSLHLPPVAAILLGALALTPLPAAATAELSLSGRGGPWLLLRDARAAAPTDSPLGSLALAGEPRALAAGDLDGDGMPDLAVGLATATGGRVVIYPGNVDHLYPNEPSENARRAAGTSVAEAFLPAATAIELAAAPDFLAIGDFDADGKADLVAAALGATAIELAAGDGHGGFLAPRALALDGSITAFAAGEIDQRDLLVDLAIAVVRDGEAAVIVLAGPQGAARAGAERLSLASSAQALLLDTLDGDTHHDLAVATADEVELFFGLVQVPEAAVGQRRRHEAVLPFAASALAGGDFAADHGDYRRELALVGADGELHVVRIERAADGRVTHTTEAVVSAVAEGGATQLVPAHLNSAGREQVVVLDRGAALHIAQPELPASQRGTGRERLEFAGDSSPIAALALRLNRDPFADLVLLTAGSAEPIVLETHGASTFTVTVETNDSDCNTTNTTCETNAGSGCGSGGCSLRAAIQQANAASSPGADTIEFAIGASGSAHLLNNDSQPILESLTLDGTTQPGYAGDPLIHVFYWAGGGAFNCQTGSCTVRGFGLTGPNGSVAFQGTASNCFVEGNRSGPAMAQPAPSTDLYFAIGSSSVTIGGAAAPARNYFFGGNSTYAVVQGANHVLRNNWFGLTPAGVFDSTAADLLTFSGVSSASLLDNVISGAVNDGFQRTNIAINGANGFVIQGNFVGTDATGNTAVGNIGWGLMTGNDESNLTIGGSAPGQGNVFAGHGQYGLWVQTSAGGNVLRGNKIGIGADGVTDLGNGLAGLRVGYGATTSITVGGIGAGEGNMIANNGGAGVLVQDGWNHRIRGNSIFDNTGIGIDLTSQGNGAGVSPNDVGDADGGDWSGHGNQYQNFPVLSRAGGTTVAGTLNSAASATYDVDFYSNPTCDGSGYGEGKTYLGSTQVTTDATGNGCFTATVSAFADALFITATATDANGNTSELSACRTADTTAIFADGFESGLLCAWSSATQ